MTFIEERERTPPSAGDPKSGDTARRWLALLPGLVVLAVGLLFVTNRAPGDDSALFGLPLDDAWIHLVYARGLATEGGLNYNPGVAETGATSPLWVLLLAPLHLVAAPLGTPVLVLAVKLVGLLFGVAGVFALQAVARGLGAGRSEALVVALVAAVDPALAFGRVSGMEGPLFVFLVLSALALALRGQLLTAAIASGLAIVARPEGVLLLPFVALLAWRAAEGEERRPGRLATAALAALLPAALWSAFCLAATGRPLPNTFYAKFEAGGAGFLANLGVAWSDYIHSSEPYFLLEAGSVLAILGAVAIVRRGGVRGALVLGAGALLLVATAASRTIAPGPFHYWERWLVPAIPFLLMALAAGPFALAAHIERSGAPRRTARAVAVAVVLLALALLPLRLRQRAHEYAWNCRNIDELAVAAGRWVSANVPAGEAVAALDAGAIRWFGERETIDLLGLNDHRIRAEIAARRGAEYLWSRGVRWVIVPPAIVPGLVEALRLEPVAELVAPFYTIARAEQSPVVIYRLRPPPSV